MKKDFTSSLTAKKGMCSVCLFEIMKECSIEGDLPKENHARGKTELSFCFLYKKMISQNCCHTMRQSNSMQVEKKDYGDFRQLIINILFFLYFVALIVLVKF